MLFIKMHLKNLLKKSKKKNYNIYKIINCNILDYKFTDNSLIYMYEPLWDVENNDVYIKLFQKLDALNYNIDIIYLTGLFVKKLDHHFFNKYTCNIKMTYSLSFPARCVNQLDF